MGRRREPLPALLASLQADLAQWRASRPAGQRIPEELWKQAEACAAQFGVSRTATALQLSYYTLQRRLLGSAGAVPSAGQPAPARGTKPVTAGFVELPPVALSECTIEVENAAGVKLRLALRGSYNLIDVPAVVRGMWER
jgi:hypothetical protein